MKACLQMQPEFCSREKLLHYFKRQQNEKPTPKQYYLFTDSSKHSWSGILVQYLAQIMMTELKLKYHTQLLIKEEHSKVLKKNWSTLTKEAYAIHMSFQKMVFYLKEAHVRVRSNHAPLQKFVDSMTKNDKVHNWSQERHAVKLHIEREHTEGKDNVLPDSLPELRHLGLHDDNDPEEPDQEYSKSTVETE